MGEAARSRLDPPESPESQWVAWPLGQWGRAPTSSGTVTCPDLSAEVCVTAGSGTNWPPSRPKPEWCQQMWVGCPLHARCRPRVISLGPQGPHEAATLQTRKLRYGEAACLGPGVRSAQRRPSVLGASFSQSGDGVRLCPRGHGSGGASEGTETSVPTAEGQRVEGEGWEGLVARRETESARHPSSPPRPTLSASIPGAETSRTLAAVPPGAGAGSRRCCRDLQEWKVGELGSPGSH